MNEIRTLRREIQTLREQLTRVDSRARQAWQYPASSRGGASAAPHRTLLIEGGNAAQIGNGLNGIQYVAAPLTLASAYDPNVDTVYPAGLGRGILFEDGIPRSGYVLVRHNFGGYPFPALAGNIFRAAGTTTLTYTPGGGPAVTMTAWFFDYV